MTIQPHQIIGVGIIILNLIPFIIKKPKYIFVTAILTVLILFLYNLAK